MSSGNAYETLFRQWSFVSKLVIDGKRDPAKVSKALQELIDESPGHYERARLILGKDFIPAEEISQARRISYSDEQLKMFADTLPSEAELTWLRDNNFMLVAGPPSPMSLLEVQAMEGKYFYVKSGGWYREDTEKFSRDDKARTAWLGLRKESVPCSTSKNWDEQNSLLTEIERVPNSAETAWGVTSYKAVRNIYLLEGIHVRTSSISSGGHRVDLGDFDHVGLYIIGDYCYCDRADVGLASARIFNPNLNP